MDVTSGPRGAAAATGGRLPPDLRCHLLHTYNSEPHPGLSSGQVTFLMNVCVCFCVGEWRTPYVRTCRLETEVMNVHSVVCVCVCVWCSAPLGQR